MNNTKPKLRYIPDRFGRVNQGHWTRERDPFGRLPETRNEEPFDLSNIYNLNGRITGQGNSNHNDVAKIEVLLDQAGVFDISETQGPTGYYGLRLEQGLKKFQKQRGLQVDGKIDPNGETLQALKSVLGDKEAIQSAAQKLQKMGRKGDKVLAHLNRQEAEHLHRITDGGSINPKTGLLEFYVDDFSDMPDNDFSAPDNSSLDSGMSEAINNAYNKGSPGGSNNNASGPEYHDDGTGNNPSPSGFEGGREGGSDSTAIERAYQKTVQQQAKKNQQAKDRAARARANPAKPENPLSKPSDDSRNPQARARAERANPKNLLDEDLAKNMSGPELDYSTISVKPSEKPKSGETESYSGIDLLSATQKAKNAEMVEIIGRLNKGREEKADKFGYVAPDHLKSPPSKKMPGLNTREFLADPVNRAIAALMVPLLLNPRTWNGPIRDILNSPLPKTEEEAVKLGYNLQTYGKSLMHQDFKGKPETKYTRPNGLGSDEAVYDGKTGKPISNSPLEGTYNYVDPDSSKVGHFFADMLPFVLFDLPPGDAPKMIQKSLEYYINQWNSNE